MDIDLRVKWILHGNRKAPRADMGLFFMESSRKKQVKNKPNS